MLKYQIKIRKIVAVFDDDIHNVEIISNLKHRFFLEIFEKYLLLSNGLIIYGIQRS